MKQETEHIMTPYRKLEKGMNNSQILMLNVKYIELACRLQHNALFGANWRYVFHGRLMTAVTKHLQLCLPISSFLISHFGNDPDDP